MTLTTLLPTLRRSIPDPLNIDRWPELTSATTTDVIVSGVSMLRLVDICGTPCVHTAAAVIPRTGGRPSENLGATTVVLTVTAVQLDAAGVQRITLDGSLCRVQPVWSEARLIGRASTARAIATSVVQVPGPWDTSHQHGTRDQHGDVSLPTGMPGDLVVGDLVIVPCPGIFALRDITGRGNSHNNNSAVTVDSAPVIPAFSETPSAEIWDAMNAHPVSQGWLTRLR